MAKKKPSDETPNVHNEIKGFNIYINEFGEIKTNQSIDALNSFLNKHVDDKKLNETSLPMSHTDENTEGNNNDDVLFNDDEDSIPPDDIDTF